MIIDELIALLGFETKGDENLKRFRDGIEGAQKRLEEFGKRVVEIGRKVALGIAAMATASAAAVMGAFKFATSQATLLSQLDDTAKMLGVNVERLQEYRHAAEMNGMTAGNLDVALRRFVRRSAEAAQGTGAAKNAFKELGVSLKDNEGRLKAGEDLLLEVADAMTKVKDHGDKLRLAFQMFDTDGAKMVSVMANGRAEFEKWAELGWQGGMFFTQEDIDTAKRYTDTLDIFRKMLGGLRTSIALDMMPALTGVLERLNDWYLVNQAIVRQRISSALEFGTRAIESFGATAWRVAGAIEWLSKKITDLTGLTSGDQMKLLGAGAAGWAAMRHPVLAGLAAAFLMLDDLRAYMEGEDSLIGKFLDELDKVQARIDEFRAGKEAEAGLPLVPKSWFDQLLEFDEALMRTFGLKPGDLDISQLWGGWNLTSNVLQPMWLEFEAWWDRLVQGFHDVGRNAAAAFLNGLRAIVSPDIPTRDVDPNSPLGWIERFRGSPLIRDGEPGSGKTGRIPLASPDSSRFGGDAPAPANAEALLNSLQNLKAWGDYANGGAAAATLNDNSVANDNRDQSVNVGSPNVTVNVQQAVEAPAAVGSAVGNAVGAAAVPPARRVTGN